MQLVKSQGVLSVENGGLEIVQAPSRGLGRKIAAFGAAVGGAVAVAHAEAVDYGAAVTTNFTVIDTLWGKVATIMISVALVTVCVKFFRKTH